VSGQYRLIDLAQDLQPLRGAPQLPFRLAARGKIAGILQGGRNLAGDALQKGRCFVHALPSLSVVPCLPNCRYDGPAMPIN
jgi:hypothetical protein